MNDSRVSLLDLWKANCRAHPDKPAVIDADGAETTFAGLEEKARFLAESLARSDGTPRLIAVHLPNGTRWLAYYLAVLRCGHVFLPIDPQYQSEAARQLAQRLGASRIISENGTESFDSPLAPPAGAHLVKLTSASTGNSKALFFAEAQMRADGEHIIAGMGLRPTDRHLVTIPLGHSYALGNLVLPLILQGATLVCAESPWPHALKATVARHAVTVLPLVPPLVRGLASLPDEDSLPDSVRLVISAGGPLQPAVAQAFLNRHGLPVHNFYGASETGGIAFDAEGAATTTGRGAGRALPGVAVTTDETGALTVTSAAVWRPLPGTGPATFTLADEGELNADGELVLRGRRDDVVKIGGRRISIGEIESKLRQLAGIDDVAVVMLKDDRLEPRLAALVATSEQSEAIRARARARLPSWKCPRIWRTCAHLPFNSRGKIDRAAVLRAFDG